MKLLVNGASISAKANSWPVHLQKKLNCDMFNYSMPAAGYTYVHETTVEAVAKERYDLAIIMWPEVLIRVDWKIGNPVPFKNNVWASDYLSKIYNNHEGLDPSLEHANSYIPKDWIHSQGYLASKFNNKNAEVELDSVSQLFDSHYQVVKYPQFLYHALIKIISLQSVFKSMNIPYVFLFLEPQQRHARYADLYNAIDWDNFYTETYLKELALENNWLDADNENYPGTEAYMVFADLLYDHLKSKGYV